jgi:hypothetical protein
MKSNILATLLPFLPLALTFSSPSTYDSEAIPLHSSVINSAAYSAFRTHLTLALSLNLIIGRDDEPDPDRNTTLQDGLVFVVQCVDAGFRGDCLVFGAPPGDCGKFSDIFPWT